MVVMRILSVLAVAFLLSGIPAQASVFRQRGPASWYGPGFNGHVMANGEKFWQNDPNLAAYLGLPLGTVIRVTNIQNRKSLLMLVADHGPYCCKDMHRIIDVSHAAAIYLGFDRAGIATVEISAVKNFDEALIRPKAPPEPMNLLEFAKKLHVWRTIDSSFKAPIAIGSSVFKTRRS
jgi:rare lipoprotein A